MAKDGAKALAKWEERYANLSQTIGARWTPSAVLTDHQAKGMRMLV